MSVPVVAFFNNKGGVGKTTLVFHLSWILADMHVKVLAADLDPQANLSAAFLDEDEIEILWEEEAAATTVYACIKPLLRGTGDISSPRLEVVDEHLAVLAGDLQLSAFEDELSSQWPVALGGNERAFRVLSALWRIMQAAAASHKAQIILLDLGPNLGSINRASLISADYVVVPLSPDLFSLQGLRNLGPTFGSWRRDWRDRLKRAPKLDIDLPEGRMEPIGYVVLQHSMRLDRPVKAYKKWINRIPGDYRKYVLGESEGTRLPLADHGHELGQLKHYRSLMPMAQEARKPIFHLKPADGAIGAHLQSARAAETDFAALAAEILRRIGM
jgi:cellulose biosynthesis protein BcsQ